MNAVEIEQAVSELAEQPFDAAEFPFAFLRAFGNKDTTIKRLRSGESNKSDLGGVLQTNHIHIKVTEPGAVTAAFEALKGSPATKRFKARFVLATDGVELQAEDLTSDEAPVICAFADFPNHFGSLLALGGISTVKQVRESTFDIRATSRLNRLYVELLKDNPEWGTAARRPDMNHFMARLIFCFFAEDTDIFNGKRLFTATVEQMTERDGADSREVIGAIFTAMNTHTQHNGEPDGRYRKAAALRPWADAFPYVNGGLFSGSTDVPRFSRIARSYLINIGSLDWTRINPDIFGSMIQAVADDEERGALGMHYTSVPNILKVLNPLFLARLRVVYSNATESNLLLRSLQRALYKDDGGRRITEANAGPLFASTSDEEDLASGTIYVLRSKSDEPYVAQHRELLHKIGVTGGDVQQRVANARLDATFLLADVEIVATYRLFNINRTKLENIIHRVFGPARLDISIPDRFGNKVVPREWFLVPLFIIDEVVDRIKDGSIADMRYDPATAKLIAA